MVTIATLLLWPHIRGSEASTGNLNIQPVLQVEAQEAAPIEQTQAQPVEAAPTPASPEPVPQPQPVQHPKGCENYIGLVSKYDWNVTVALNVMRAESGCNPSAVGDGHLTYWLNGIKYGMSCGMFQVRFLPGRPSCEQMHDPAQNIAYAYGLYKSGGWRHWSVCNKGIVRCY